MQPKSERNRRRDQTARLPGRWRHLRYCTPRDDLDDEIQEAHPRVPDNE